MAERFPSSSEGERNRRRGDSRHSSPGSQTISPENQQHLGTFMYLTMIHSYISERANTDDIKEELEELFALLESSKMAVNAEFLIRNAANILKEKIKHDAKHIRNEDASPHDIPSMILKYLSQEDLTNIDPTLEAYLKTNYQKKKEQVIEEKEFDALKQTIAKKVQEMVRKELDELKEQITRMKEDHKRTEKRQQKEIESLRKLLKQEQEKNEDFKSIPANELKPANELEPANDSKPNDTVAWRYLAYLLAGTLIGGFTGLAIGGGVALVMGASTVGTVVLTAAGVGTVATAGAGVGHVVHSRRHPEGGDTVTQEEQKKEEDKETEGKKEK